MKSTTNRVSRSPSIRWLETSMSVSGSGSESSICSPISSGTLIEFRSVAGDLSVRCRVTRQDHDHQRAVERADDHAVPQRLRSGSRICHPQKGEEFVRRSVHRRPVLDHFRVPAALVARVMEATGGRDHVLPWTEGPSADIELGSQSFRLVRRTIFAGVP